jgi:hypothetical protein
MLAMMASTSISVPFALKVDIGLLDARSASRGPGVLSSGQFVVRESV